MRSYAGIGSRSTPPAILERIAEVAHDLASLGFELRTGRAEGADYAFECAARASGGMVTTYLPWASFNKHLPMQYRLPDGGHCRTMMGPTPLAREVASKLHPYWLTLSTGTKRLHARNVHQVLGDDCKTPCEFVVCWTPDGAETVTTSLTGGTGMAIRVANAWPTPIPVVNMARDGWADRLWEAEAGMLKVKS